MYVVSSRSCIAATTEAQDLLIAPSFSKGRFKKALCAVARFQVQP